MLSSFEISGIGVHTGVCSNVRVHPNTKDKGIVFISQNRRIPACVQSLDLKSRRNTNLLFNGAKIQTTEHLLAAAAMLNQKDLYIEVSGPEIPILDGSSSTWFELMQKAFAQCCTKPELIPVKEKAIINSKDSVAEIIPVDKEEEAYIEVELDLSQVSMGMIKKRFHPTVENFEEIASARTFVFESEVEKLRSSGLIKGGNLNNALVLGPKGPLNPKEQNSYDEPARHKIIDIIGDLFLLGALPRAIIKMKRPGHHLNHAVVQSLSKLVNNKL